MTRFSSSGAEVATAHEEAVAPATPGLVASLARFRERIRSLDYLDIYRLHCYELAPRVLAESLRQTLKFAPPAAQALFRLLYFREPVAVAETEELFGRALTRELQEAGILAPSGADCLASPFRLELIGESLLFTEELLNRPQAVYYGEDSQFLRNMLDPEPGDVCLDLCTGSGIQGLRCAQVAARADLVDVHPPAVRLATLNAALNGVSSRVEVFQGDLWDALPPDRRYDFVTCNPPLMPVVDEVKFPLYGHGGPDGLRLVDRILEQLPSRLSERGRIALIGACTGDEQQPDIAKRVDAYLGDGFESKLFVLLRAPLRDWVRRIALTASLFYEDLNFQNAVLRSNVAYAQDAGKTRVYTYLLRARRRAGGRCQVIDYSRVGQRSYWFVNRGTIAE